MSAYNEQAASDAQVEAYESFFDALTPKQQLERITEWMDGDYRVGPCMTVLVGDTVWVGTHGMTSIKVNLHDAFSDWDCARWIASGAYERGQPDPGYDGLGAAA